MKNRKCAFCGIETTIEVFNLDGSFSHLETILHDCEKRENFIKETYMNLKTNLNIKSKE
jgi:hypothetical protein